MHSFVVGKEAINGNKVEITEISDVNHIKNVLRLKNGEVIRIVDGEFEYQAVIVDVEKKAVIAEIKEKDLDKYSLTTNISAAISLIKNDKMDIAVQKLTEIGIKNIYPVITKRTAIKLAEKKERWDKIIKETLKQCGGVTMPNVFEPIQLDKLDLEGYDLIILPYEEHNGERITDILKTKKDIKNILYIIGPEGGFDSSEVEKMVAKGARPVTLGKRILRAETAAIVTGGILANELG